MDIKISLPLLPLRDIVVFPSMVIPLFVGRDKSISALNEVMKKDKKMKRMAFLIKAGLDEEEASKAVESFENLDDSTFENMAALITSVASQNKNVEESVATEKTVSTEESKSVKEEAVDASVLEDIEPSETTDIAVGTDDSEDEVFSTRAALVDFISNRLNQ